MKYTLVRIGLIIMSCACAAALSCSTSSGPVRYKIDRLLLGTLVEITVTADRETASKAAYAAADEIKRVEDLTSFHQASQLGEVNDSAGKEFVSIDPELLSLLKDSLKFARMTDGAFDPTVGPLSRLWGFSSDEPKLPTDAEIESALKLVGWKRVRIDEKKHAVLLSEKGMSLDLGAIAKGYALDRAGLVLKDCGIRSALINAGGDILAIGEKKPGNPWRVGVQDPRNSRSIMAVTELRDEVVVTSGDYERFFVRDNVRYHHILDPRTGRPARPTQSVTIVAKDGVTADALATAVFVMGPERGLELIEKSHNVEALIVDSTGRLIMSSGGRKIFDTN